VESVGSSRESLSEEKEVEKKQVDGRERWRRRGGTNSRPTLSATL
jgi:hypothetical protein